jgi:hypothetical protein
MATSGRLMEVRLLRSMVKRTPSCIWNLLKGSHKVLGSRHSSRALGIRTSLLLDGWEALLWKKFVPACDSRMQNCSIHQIRRDLRHPLALATSAAFE